VTPTVARTAVPTVARTAGRADPSMSAPATERASGLRLGRPALARCVADPERFPREVWGRAPQLSRAEDLPGDVADLLSREDVDELLSTRGLRTPFLRVARRGETLPSRDFTAPGGVGAGIADQVSDERLTALFADGATIVLQALHRTWPPLVDFAQDLAAELGHPVQVNAYVTPPQSQGFSDHYDVHDVFVLQVEGAKRWMVRAPVHPAPLRDQPWTDHADDVRQAAQDEPLLDVVLHPGDCLYLPRGFLHAATALSEVCTHLTIGVHTWTRHTVAEELAGAALVVLADDPEVRGPLPLGADVGSVDAVAADLERVRARMHRAIDGIDAEVLAGRLARRSREAQRAAPIGPLAQHRAAETADAGTRVALRRHLQARLRPSPRGHVLESRAGSVEVAARDLPSVERLLDGEPARVGDLPGAGDSDLDLVRRLLALGVLVPA